MTRHHYGYVTAYRFLLPEEMLFRLPIYQYLSWEHFLLLPIAPKSYAIVGR